MMGKGKKKSNRGRPPGTKKADKENKAATQKRKSTKKQQHQQRQSMASFLAGANDNCGGGQTGASASKGQQVVQEDNPIMEVPKREEINPSPMVTNGLDSDEGLVAQVAVDANDDDDNDDDNDAEDIFEGLQPEGPMKVYLQNIFEQLKKEMKKDAVTSRWLLALLCEHKWSIPAVRAKQVCSKLNIEYDEPSYYHDIVVWLLDEQFLVKIHHAPHVCTVARSTDGRPIILAV